MLTTEKQVAPATHRQALNALLFPYTHVLKVAASGTVSPLDAMAFET